MAQYIEVNEKTINGINHKTPVVKAFNTEYIERTQAVDALGTNDTEIFLGGKSVKDLRRVDEDQSSVLSGINATPTSDVQKAFSVTIVKREGDLQERVEPYGLNLLKSDVVEFYSDGGSGTVIVTQGNNNKAERVVYYASQDYSSIKTRWDL